MKCKNCSDTGYLEDMGVTKHCRECRRGWALRDETLRASLRHHAERLRATRSELEHIKTNGYPADMIKN
jgi:hypothetical protein